MFTKRVNFEYVFEESVIHAIYLRTYIYTFMVVMYEFFVTLICVCNKNVRKKRFRAIKNGSRKTFRQTVEISILVHEP